MMKIQLDRLFRKRDSQTLHINRRLLKAIADEVVLNKENYQQLHQHQHYENERQQEDAQSQVDPSTTTLTTSVLLDLLCSAMDSSSSTLQEVWINDDMIQYSKSNDDDGDDMGTDDDNTTLTLTADTNKEQKQDKHAASCGQQQRLLQTLTTLPCLRRLRFYLSSTMTKTQSEAFMQVVAPTIRACTMLKSLHFCMSNTIRPAPADVQQQQDQLQHAAHTTVHNNTSIIAVGLCLTPTALHTLAKVGLENHASLSEFGLQDVTIVGNHKHPASSGAAASVQQQFPLDPILMALANLPRLETVDISLSKPLLQSPPPSSTRQNGLRRRGQEVVAASTTTTSRRPCFFSGRALTTFFQKARQLKDVTLWDVGLNNEHFALSSCPGHLLHALQFHPRLQFLSLRGNPGMTRIGWYKFYKMLLNGNYILKSLFHDGGFDDDLEKAIDQVLYWNLLGRGRLFSSSSSLSPSSSLSDSASLSSPSSSSSSSSPTSTTRHDAVDDDDSTRSDWIDMLENVNDDVTSLYYFLRQGNAILMPRSSSSSSSSSC